MYPYYSSLPGGLDNLFGNAIATASLVPRRNYSLSGVHPRFLWSRRATAWTVFPYNSSLPVGLDSASCIKHILIRKRSPRYHNASYTKPCILAPTCTNQIIDAKKPLPPPSQAGADRIAVRLAKLLKIILRQRLGTVLLFLEKSRRWFNSVSKEALCLTLH